MLEKVIKQKHGHKRAKTDKICKFFIDAIEKSKYGWFWKCPNGEECIYKHALPEGWKLRDSNLADKKKELSFEDAIEKERLKLTGNLTPLTKDLFDAWKEKWLQKMKNEKENEMKKELAEKKKDKKFLDPNFKFLSGRSMFVFCAEDENEDDGDDDDLQELIRNRKRVTDEDEDENKENNAKDNEDEQDLIDNVDLPDDDFGE